MDFIEIHENHGSVVDTDVSPWAPHLDLAVLCVFSGFMPKSTGNSQIQKDSDEIRKFRPQKPCISVDSH